MNAMEWNFNIIVITTHPPTCDRFNSSTLACQSQVIACLSLSFALFRSFRLFLTALISLIYRQNDKSIPIGYINSNFIWSLMFETFNVYTNGYACLWLPLISSVNLLSQAFCVCIYVYYVGSLFHSFSHSFSISLWKFVSFKGPSKGGNIQCIK